MDIKSDLLKGSGGFAIEAYPRGPDFKLRDDICNKKSDVLLKPLIDDCHGNLIIRFLTTQERNQIRQYKDQQKGEITSYIDQLTSIKFILKQTSSDLSQVLIAPFSL